MVRQVNVTAAKAGLLRLVDEVAAGDEVEITKHGRPVARLVPASGARSLKGSMAGVAMTAREDDDLAGTGQVWETQ